MGSVQAKKDAIDLSHHINRKSKARHPSPLKDIIKFMGYDGMISLAGGLPHPSLFPLEQIQFQTLTPTAPLAGDGSITSRPASDVQSLTLGRGANPGDVELTPFLQYGTCTGNAELLAVCRELTEAVHAPPCAYDVLLHPGNTNAWAKAVGLLCEDGDFVLVEEFTYPSAQALWIPMGVRAAPVGADASGLRADDLRRVLETWDEAARGAPRPHVLYLVSVGSNPTGISISAERRREIYALCVEFDIVIVEDDPYYFLQYPAYQPSSSATTTTTSSTEGGLLPPSDFVASLTPSFLSMDVEGRVIRLESFSKTLFPGLRLGYFVANPTFTERLLRATEVETQDPSGLSQAYVLGLLRQWGVAGYLDWLQGLRTQYRVRRDWLLDAFSANFVLVPAAESPLPAAQGLVACVRREGSGDLRPVFSFVDPGAGMFVWSKFYFARIPRFAELAADAELADPEQAFADEVWKAWADALVLMTPGNYYHPWQGSDKTTTSARGAEAATAHFRFSFATPTKTQIESAVQRMRKVVDRYWA